MQYTHYAKQNRGTPDCLDVLENNKILPHFALLYTIVISYQEQGK